jgi:hypothetical protein
MSDNQLYIGSTPVHTKVDGGQGEFVRKNEETWYKISGFDAMEPFFMTVVSHSDHWLFMSSNGSLTAGRKNPESSLFPYYTDDKIIDSPELTGSKTILRVTQNGKRFLWEPFSDRYAGAYRTERNLYKNKFGNRVQFEEINADLGLVFRYTWSFSDEYGFVKQSELENTGDSTVEVEVLDGMQNILPYGVNSTTQAIRSTLVDAYKKNELEADTGLGIFALSAMIVDKAEPSEALSATTVWCKGLEADKYLLSSRQLDSFRRGEELENEDFIKAIHASYFVHAHVSLDANTTQNWMLVAEVNQSTAEVIDLNNQLLNDAALTEKVRADIKEGTKSLQKLVGLADGLQKSADKLSSTRHYSNVLFNIMRGGIFEAQYVIDVQDLMDYAQTINRKVYNEEKAFFSGLKKGLSYSDLLQSAHENGSPSLVRICTEYLPISFSRRHGDPSRPWNNFTIEIVDEEGHRKHNYEGNWRDIFQNWEALAYSFPGFIEGMITKFVNASTIDGYNPYRITRDGIDWEVIEPDDPWSYIGYWGDHQIIYLQKLLEHIERHYPGKLDGMLTQSNYAYANVPYRIRGFEDIMNNPYDTIDFDHVLAGEIDEKVAQVGADGKLIWRNDELLQANLLEKLLVMTLTKLYNYVPDGGIWLNTQRPEWNDANNALVGNGLSMVTLNYLRRFLVFINGVIEKLPEEEIEMHSAVADLAIDVHEIFTNTSMDFTPASRREFVEALGRAGERYRNAAYNSFEEGKSTLSKAKIRELIGSARAHAEKTIAANRREDGLYHAYNLLAFNKDGAHVSYLYEMLEGQVAALSSGLLSPEESVSVLDALKNSEMYRPDQYSYMLYPNRVLSTFISKNTIPGEYVSKSALMKKLVDNGDRRLVEADSSGALHFAGDVHNAKDVKRILQDFSDDAGLAALADAEQQLVLDAFEEVFNHVAFTGRSGTFYGYEGLGSIYWHMVSKLLLSVQESIYRAVDQHASDVTLGKLMEHYYEIRAGIGINKAPKLYGAFPTDAYSHTPFDAGAQQPGLTGQVKEDVINRWAELGVQVHDGCIHIQPVILHKKELLKRTESYTYIGVDGESHTKDVTNDQMAFTYCSTLFTYNWAENAGLKVVMADGNEIEQSDLIISAELSAEIFSRSGKVKEVIVAYPVR